MRLTDHSCKRLLAPAKGRVTYNDDALPGFGIRVSANGVKSFVLVIGRARKRITIGRYPIITLADARARARELIAARVLGKDEVLAVKFEDAIPVFIASRYGDRYQKPRTRDESERVLRKYFLSKFRYEQLSTIRSHQIADIIDKLRKTPSTAYHAYGVIRLFFKWAEGRQYVLRSPCTHLQPPPASRARDRVLSRDEIKAILTALPGGNATYAVIVELLLYTGQRRGEIMSIRAEWIDWKARTITFPASVTKNRRRHTIPFGDRVEELLRKGEKKGLLFPAACTEGKRPFAGWSKSKTQLDKRCLLPVWRLHDLRRTFATNLGALGVPVHVTEKALNHVSGTLSGIVAVYQRHTYEREIREAMTLWEAYLTDLMREPVNASEGNDAEDCVRNAA